MRGVPGAPAGTAPSSTTLVPRGPWTVSGTASEVHVNSRAAPVRTRIIARTVIYTSMKTTREFLPTVSSRRTFSIMVTGTAMKMPTIPHR